MSGMVKAQCCVDFQEAGIGGPADFRLSGSVAGNCGQRRYPGCLFGRGTGGQEYCEDSGHRPGGDSGSADAENRQFGKHAGT